MYRCLCRCRNCDEGIAEQCADIAMVDIGLPGINGIEMIKFLKEHCPKTLCMICTAYDEDEKVYEALEAGAYSYFKIFLTFHYS
jgi:DNA-binding NarL/FixJ family response regulator